MAWPISSGQGILRMCTDSAKVTAGSFAGCGTICVLIFLAKLLAARVGIITSHSVCGLIKFIAEILKFHIRKFDL